MNEDFYNKKIQSRHRKSESHRGRGFHMKSHQMLSGGQLPAMDAIDEQLDAIQMEIECGE